MSSSIYFPLLALVVAILSLYKVMTSRKGQRHRNMLLLKRIFNLAEKLGDRNLSLFGVTMVTGKWVTFRRLDGSSLTLLVTGENIVVIDSGHGFESGKRTDNPMKVAAALLALSDRVSKIPPLSAS